MILIDTSVWIHIFKGKKGTEAKRIQIWLDDREAFLTRFNQLELLQGCRDNKVIKGSASLIFIVFTFPISTMSCKLCCS